MEPDTNEENLLVGDSNLVAYRLGKVEKATDHISRRLDTLIEIKTSIDVLEIKVKGLEDWKKNVIAYLVALSLLVIGALVGMAVR